MSFVGYPELPAKLEQVRTSLARLGGDSLGIPWNWLDESPPTARADRLPVPFPTARARPHAG